MFAHLAPDKLFSLAGKVAMITAGAGGIASGLAQGFAAAGATLSRLSSEGQRMPA